MTEPVAPGAGGAREQDYYRGVASVRQHHRPAMGDTSEVPVVESLDPTRVGGSRPAAGQKRGLVVRRRGRRLRAGAPWTWLGVSIVVICWGIWMASVRDRGLVVPMIGLILVLATGLLLFVLARLLGRTVIEGMLNRERLSAWPSHLTVCLFLTAAGVAFLQQTVWIRDSWTWVGDSWQWLVDGWNWLVDLWPF